MEVNNYPVAVIVSGKSYGTKVLVNKGLAPADLDVE